MPVRHVLHAAAADPRQAGAAGGGHRHPGQPQRGRRAGHRRSCSRPGLGCSAHDMLEKMRLHTRPYEFVAGMSDADLRSLSEEAMRSHARAAARDHAAPGQAALRCWADHTEADRGPAAAGAAGLRGRAAAQRERSLARWSDWSASSSCASTTARTRRSCASSSSAGAEVWLAPMTEFFSYCQLHRALLLAGDRWRDCGA